METLSTNKILNITEAGNLEGKRVLLRLDLNVPLLHGEIRDPFRIDESLKTLAYLREKGAKTIIISHIGKDKSGTLKPVADYMSKTIPLTFLPTLDDPRNAEVIAKLPNGGVAMLENLRSNLGEEANDGKYALDLASLADIYVNDAFSVAHRKHASVVGVPKLIRGYLGFQFADEIAHLSRALKPEHPFVFVLGGAKISTKMPLLTKFLSLADYVFVGGALANTLLFAKGLPVGVSVYDKDTGDLSGILNHPKLVLPQDVVVRKGGEHRTCLTKEVRTDEMIVDVGTQSILGLKESMAKASLLVWNGPLGFYEEGFTEGTEELLRVVSESSATSIIGGGDTVALINDLHMIDRFTFVSTGGGAMLDYLANETLPGLEALKNS